MKKKQHPFIKYYTDTLRHVVYTHPLHVCAFLEQRYTLRFLCFKYHRWSMVHEIHFEFIIPAPEKPVFDFGFGNDYDEQDFTKPIAQCMLNGCTPMELWHPDFFKLEERLLDIVKVHNQVVRQDLHMRNQLKNSFNG